MGSNVSSSTDMPDTIEQLIAKLDLTALAKDYGKKTSEKDYVYVDGDNMQTPPSTSGSEGSESYSETISIASTEQWEKELMEDPKVCDWVYCTITKHLTHHTNLFGMFTGFHPCITTIFPMSSNIDHH